MENHPVHQGGFYAMRLCYKNQGIKDAFCHTQEEGAATLLMPSCSFFSRDHEFGVYCLLEQSSPKPQI